MSESIRLLADIRQAEADNNQRLGYRRVGCAVCNALREMAPDVRIAVDQAISARTIGRDKLVAILKSNGYDVGRRPLERHRDEGHTL